MLPRYPKHEISLPIFSLLFFCFSNHSGFNNDYPLPTRKLHLIHISAAYDNLEAFLFCLSNKLFSIRTPSLNLHEPIHYACASGSYEILSYILSVDSSLSRFRYPVENSLCYFAVYSGCTRILKLILKNGFTPNHTTEDLICSAVRMKKNECLRILLKNGFTAKSHNSIQTAFTSFNFEAIEILANFGINPNVRLTNGKHIFIVACELRQKQLAKILMKQIYDDQSTDTSLSYALCLLGSSSVMRYFLANIRFDIKKPCRNGSELHKALIDLPPKKALKMIKLLYKHGYDLDYISDESHSTFLTDVCMCAERPSLDLIYWLLENGANPYVPIVKFNNICLYHHIQEMAKTYIYGQRMKPILETFNKFIQNKKENQNKE